MRKILLAVLFAASSYSASTMASSWGHYGTQQKAKQCSDILSVWFPNHPHACPSPITFEELAPGLEVGTSRQSFDWRRHTIYSDITLRNNTGADLPVGSKLIVTSSNLRVINADGLTENTNQPFYLIDTSLANGASLPNPYIEVRPQLERL